MASPSLCRDRDVRLAIASILEMTCEFDGVYLRSLSEVPGRAAGDTRAVSIEPDSIEFSDPWGDGNATTDPGAMLVTSRVTLTFLARDEDPVARDEAAERLANIASNSLNDCSLADLTMPSFTRFLSLKWLPPGPPERRISATFEYRYIIDNWTDFDTTD